MRSIIRSSLQFRFLVIILAGVMLLSGINQLRAMPVDVLPEFSPPFVEIQIEALGLSAEEVEQMITVPLEQDLLAGVAWLDVIRSQSVPGLSSTLIYFEPGTDLYRARQMVAERLAQAAVGIPHVSKPPMMIQPTSSASRFMIVGLSSEKLSLIEMSVLARWTIGPRLMGVPGVANVAIWGNRDRQLQVLVDPERLQAQGVSLDQVIETAGNALWVSPLSFLEASSPGTGGFIESPSQRLGVWHVLPISSPEELARVPVEGSASLTLGDVAEIVEDHQPLIGDAMIRNNPNLMLVIEKLPGTNTLEVTQGVEDAINALKPGFSDIAFDTSLFRPATFIEMALANLTRSFVIGTLLAVLALGLFFYGWRTALISIAAIVSALIAALYVLYLRGATLNMMVLAGLVIALGLITDDAIVDIENIMRRLSRNRQESSPQTTESVILEVSSEMRSTLFFVTLVTLLAVLPLFFMEGLSGSIFKPLATSYVLAVAAAMVVGLTLTPVLSVLLLSNTKNVETRESAIISWLKRSYDRTLSNTIQKSGQVYAAAAILLVVGLVAWPVIRENQMLPTFREPDIVVQVTGAPAISQPEMNRIVTLMGSELRGIQGVNNVGAHVGRAVFGDQVVGINSAQLWVSIDPQANYNVTVAAIRETASSYPGLASEVKTYLQETLEQPETGANDVFTVRVYGEEDSVLRAQAEKLKQTLAGIEGIVEPRVVLPADEPTLQIEVDLSMAKQYGVKPGDVRRAAATLLSGIQVGSLFEESKVFDVVVWGTPNTRQSITDIKDLLVDTPNGGHVRLGDVADVRVVSAPTVIQREGISPYLDVAFNVKGRGIDAVIGDVKTTIRGIRFPLEYHAVVMEDYATQRTAQQRLLMIALVAAVGIFLLLQASLSNWWLALVTFLTLPVALAGGLLAAFVSGDTLSLASLFGLFAVFGIAARNAVLLFKRYQSLEDAGEPFSPRLIMQGAQERLAPIVMTALTTGLCFLPFIVFGNLPGQEILYSMAIVILGGLTTSTLYNLFLLPAFYLRYGETGREVGLEFVPVATGDD